MSDLLSKLNFKNSDDLEAALNEVNQYNVSLPDRSTLIDGEFLKEKLSYLSLAQDTINRLERSFITDITVLKSLIQDKKDMYNISLNSKISADERKVSYVQKKTDASNMLQKEAQEISEVESLKLLVEGYYSFIKNKKSFIKQANSDLKMLYKAYLLDRPRPSRASEKPSNPYKEARVEPPWGKEGVSEEEDYSDLDAFLEPEIGPLFNI